MENKYVYTFYVATSNTKEIEVDVRDDGYTEKYWDSLNNAEKDEILDELFNSHASSLMDSGWYLKQDENETN